MGGVVTDSHWSGSCHQSAHGVSLYASVDSFYACLLYLASNANDFYYGSSHIFNEKTKLGKDIASIQNVFGQSDTYVLLVPRGDTPTKKELSDELHELSQVNGIVSIKTDAQKMYYEGKLNDNIIPWKIEIRYELNREEYSLEDLAGKDGKIKIVISIKENPSCIGDFYDKYALQTSLSLDTERFTNIEAPSATLANVGKDKQLTYTILPGKGVDIEITSFVSEKNTNIDSVQFIIKTEGIKTE